MEDSELSESSIEINTDKNETSKAEESQLSEKLKYDKVDAKLLYLNNDSHVVCKYPNINLTNENSKKINELIVNQLKLYMSDYNISKINEIKEIEETSISNDEQKQYSSTFEIEYEFNQLDDKIISISFYGFFNHKDAAHPLSTVFTINIDATTGKQIKLRDKYKIDNEFVETVKHYIDNSNLKSDPRYAHINWNFCDLQNADDSNGSDVISYYTNEGLGLSFTIIHALGDHVEAEIPYDILKKWAI